MNFQKVHRGIVKSELNELDEFLKKVESLPVEERIAIAQRLMGGKNSGLTVILGGSNVINNSFAIQLNSNSSEISEQLENLPKETFAALVDAIAIRIRNFPGNGYF